MSTLIEDLKAARDALKVGISDLEEIATQLDGDRETVDFMMEAFSRLTARIQWLEKQDPVAEIDGDGAISPMLHGLLNLRAGDKLYLIPPEPAPSAVPEGWIERVVKLARDTVASDDLEDGTKEMSTALENLVLDAMDLLETAPESATRASHTCNDQASLDL